MINPKWLKLPYLEHSFVVLKLFELLKFDCHVKQGNDMIHGLFVIYCTYMDVTTAYNLFYRAIRDIRL